MLDPLETWGGVLLNDKGRLALALAPSCQAKVVRTEYDAFSGELSVKFKDEADPLPMGILEGDLAEAANREAEILVAHFENLRDYIAHKNNREYRVPILRAL